MGNAGGLIGSTKSVVTLLLSPHQMLSPMARLKHSLRGSPVPLALPGRKSSAISSSHASEGVRPSPLGQPAGYRAQQPGTLGVETARSGGGGGGEGGGSDGAGATYCVVMVETPHHVFRPMARAAQSVAGSPDPLNLPSDMPSAAMSSSHANDPLLPSPLGQPVG